MSLSTELPGSWRLVSREERAASGQGGPLTCLETSTAEGEPVVRRLEWERA